MTSKAGLFFHPSGLESGGTNALTGKRSGTLVSISGATPLALPAVETVYTAYFRTIDDATGEDTREDSTTNAIIDLPANLEACMTYNGTFVGASLDTGVKCIGGNQPVFIKQTDFADTSAATLTIRALDWTAGTRVGQVGTVSTTPASGQITLGWSAVTGAAGYEYQYSTSATFASGNSAWIDNTDRAPVVTGLSNGTTYYFRVRAYSALGVGAASATVNAAPSVNISLSYPQSDTTWQTYITSAATGSGSVAIVSGGPQLRVYTPAASTAWGVFKQPLSRAGSWTVKRTFHVVSNNEVQYIGRLVSSSGVPTVKAADADRIFAFGRWGFQKTIGMSFFNTSGVEQFAQKDGSGTYGAYSSPTYDPDLLNGGASCYQAATNTTYYVTFTSNATNLRGVVRTGSYTGTVVFDSGDIPWSVVRDTTGKQLYVEFFGNTSGEFHVEADSIVW